VTFLVFIKPRDPSIELRKYYELPDVRCLVTFVVKPFE